MRRARKKPSGEWPDVFEITVAENDDMSALGSASVNLLPVSAPAKPKSNIEWVCVD